MQQYFPIAIDFGVSPQMFDFLGQETWDELKEVQVVKPTERKDMENRGVSWVVDFLGDHRLELNGLYVARGIRVFADYALAQLKSTKTWDLTRVGALSIKDEPEGWTDLKEQVENLWELMVFVATGKNESALDFQAIARGVKRDLTVGNRHYHATIDNLGRYKSIFAEENRLLNQIVEETSENQEYVEKLESLTDEIHLSEFIDKPQQRKDVMLKENKLREEVNKDEDDDD